MDVIVQQKLNSDPKMTNYLKENSYWYKELNRNSDNYNLFLKAMKEKYHLKVVDKINDAIDNIDMISSILDALK